MAKFIEVQHASNILMFYDKSTNYLPNNGGGSPQKAFSSIQTACNLKNSDSKEVIKELFFAPKDCLLSPSSAKINLEILHTSEPIQTASSQEIKVTKEQLSKSKVSGTLRYGIFDYSTNLRKIPYENGSKKEKHMALNINWPLTFYLGQKNPEHCFLNPIWKQVKARELTFEELKRRCI